MHTRPLPQWRFGKKSKLIISYILGEHSYNAPKSSGKIIGEKIFTFSVDTKGKALFIIQGCSNVLELKLLNTS